jgi:hypothetical protein
MELISPAISSRSRHRSSTWQRVEQPTEAPTPHTAPTLPAQEASQHEAQVIYWPAIMVLGLHKCNRVYCVMRDVVEILKPFRKPCD